VYSYCLVALSGSRAIVAVLGFVIIVAISLLCVGAAALSHKPLVECVSACATLFLGNLKV